MHPILKQKLKQLQGQIAQLDEVMSEQQDDLQGLHQEKSEILQEQWRHRKESVTLGHMTDDFADMSDDLDAVTKREAEVEKKLLKLLSYTKTLREALNRG